jgi:hypothetical protein
MQLSIYLQYNKTKLMATHNKIIPIDNHYNSNGNSCIFKEFFFLDENGNGFKAKSENYVFTNLIKIGGDEYSVGIMKSFHNDMDAYNFIENYY